MAYKKTSNSSGRSPSSVVVKKSFFTFSLGSPNAKNISYQDGFKNGKPVYKYIPNTKENRDALNKLKGKPDVYGKRKIWW